MSEDPVTDDSSTGKPATAGSLALAVLAYTVARLGLVLVIAVVIFYAAKPFGVVVPPLVAAVFGVLIALPLGMILFKSLRLRVNDQIAQVDADRSARHADLESRLRGDDK